MALSDSTDLMQALADRLVEAARRAIPGGPAGRAGQVITVEEVTPTSCTIVAHSPASWLIRGWPRAPMTWLLGKTVAFTPRNGSGPIIRKVTAKSIAAGHWIRPARAPLNVYAAAWADPGTQDTINQIAQRWGASLRVTATPSSGRIWGQVVTAGAAPFPDLF